MASTGRVVTTAGLVFAFTMGSMLSSDLRGLGQIGTTIMIGLLFDTLVVRSFMMPAIATLLGRWFWWPRRVHLHATVRVTREPPRDRNNVAAASRLRKSRITTTPSAGAGVGALGRQDSAYADGVALDGQPAPS